MAGYRLERYELVFGARILASPQAWLARGRRAQDGPYAVGQPCWRVIEPEEHLLFAYQRRFSRTSIWQAAVPGDRAPAATSR